jgi:hypothetical protein
VRRGPGRANPEGQIVYKSFVFRSAGRERTGIAILLLSASKSLKGNGEYPAKVLLVASARSLEAASAFGFRALAAWAKHGA